MHRFSRAVALTALFGFAVATTTLPGHAADLNTIKTAADQLVALAKDSAKTGQAPRMTDPKVAALLDTALDTSDLAMSAPLAPDQLGNLSNRELQLARIDAIYELAGTGLTDFDQMGKVPDQNKVLAQVGQNVVTFAPEIGRLYDAEAIVTGALIECLGNELWAHPGEYQDQDSRRGISEIRSGAVILVDAILTNITISGLTDDWRSQRIVAVVAATPYIAKFLLPEQRKLLHDTTLKSAAKLSSPVLRAGLKGLADLFVD
jgi:hypothetical protein